MDLLSQIFVRRDLVVRRALLVSLTTLMILTTVDGPTSQLGWWQKASKAPHVVYFPQIIAPTDYLVQVHVETEERLSELEISVDAGRTWVPVDFLIGSKVTYEDFGKRAAFEFSLQAGLLAHYFSPREFSDKKMRSLLLRGVTRQGLYTAPKSLVFLYRDISVEELLSKL